MIVVAYCTQEIFMDSGIRTLLFFPIPGLKRLQGVYNSGKPGNLREFVNSGELREFKIY